MAITPDLMPWVILAAIIESREVFANGLNGYSPDELHSTMGNHDCPVYGRPAKHEKTVAEHEDIFTYEVARIEQRFGWTWSPLGTMHFLGGVAFTHAPLTGMGKEVAGVVPTNTVAMAATHDIVYGHTHKGGHTKRMKFGHDNYVQALDIGCSLPQGHIDQYVRHGQMTGWWWGVHLIRISDGRIRSFDQITMADLEGRYA